MRTAIRTISALVMAGFALALPSAPAAALPGAAGLAPAVAGLNVQRVHWRSYYHCHRRMTAYGLRRSCHGGDEFDELDNGWGPGWGGPGFVPGWGPGWGGKGWHPGAGKGGKGGGGKGGKGGKAGAASDILLKRDIVPVARLDSGLGLYRYRYNWSDQVYVGVMAQEVQQIDPAAVMRGPDGYLRVHYRRLGMKLMTWQEWRASHPQVRQAD